MKNEGVCDILDDIAKTANHQIPFYAYGDNEAACDMSDRLQEIYEKAIQHIRDVNTKEKKQCRY